MRRRNSTCGTVIENTECPYYTKQDNAREPIVHLCAKTVGHKGPCKCPCGKTSHRAIVITGSLAMNEWIMELPIDNLFFRKWLSMRTVNALCNAYGKFIRFRLAEAPRLMDVINHSDEQLMCVKNFGVVCLEEIHALRTEFDEAFPGARAKEAV